MGESLRAKSDASCGDLVVWRPPFKVGVRDAFVLPANDITGAGGVATVGVHVGSSIYEVYLDAHGEDYSRYREGDLRAGVKVAF